MKKSVSLFLMVLGFAAFASAQKKDSTVAVVPAPAVEQKQLEAAAASNSEELTNLKGQVDGLSESYAETKATVGSLAKIKVSGYIQAQYQVADVMNVLSLGSASPYLRQGFAIKRGRLKTTYDGGLCQYVLEIDVTQDGVGMKDAYAMFKEPWMKAFSLTVGSMDRPFGYEVGYPSSMLESPERSKVIGKLFPKEKDLGAMLEFAPEEGDLSFLNAKVGVYNGMTNILNENNDYKDIIGRLGFKAPLRDLGFAIDGGVSGYNGMVTATDTTRGGLSYAMNDADNQWSTINSNQKGLTFKRQYFGGDLQLYYATPVIGGTCLKGEYIQGKHPAKAGADDFYGNTTNAVTDAVYGREVMGYYAYFIQNIDAVGLQAVVKYDFWDPNTKVTGADFTDENTLVSTTAGTPPVTTIKSAAQNLTKADIAYSTLGFGLLYYLPWAPNIRCMLYYEMPKNEKLENLKNTKGPLYKYIVNDNSATNLNLLTARIQVKF